MRRILAIIVLAAILVLAISVSALAKPSDPPNAFGQYTSAYAPWLLEQHGMPYGWGEVRWIMWSIQSPYSGSPYDNGGEYIASLKEFVSD